MKHTCLFYLIFQVLKVLLIKICTVEPADPGLVACTCNPATLEAEFRNGVGSIRVRGNSASIGGWIVLHL